MKHKYTSKLLILLSTFFSAIAYSINAFAISPMINVSSVNVDLGEGQSSRIEISTADFTGTAKVFSSNSNVATARFIGCDAIDTCTVRNRDISLFVQGISSGDATIQLSFSGMLTSSSIGISEYQNISVSIRNSDTTLSNLTVSPVGINFNKDTTDYTITVDHDVESVGIYATASSSRTSVTGTGDFKLKDYLNTFQVTVTAEDGSNTVYKVNVKRKDANGRTAVSSKKSNNEKSNDNKLTDILIPDCEIDFKEDIEDYSITVKPDTEKLMIRAIPSNENAKVEIEGNEEIEIGENIIKIIVTAENGDIKIFTIRVTRPDGEDATLATKRSEDGNRNVLGTTASGSKISVFTIALIAFGVATIAGTIVTVIFLKKKAATKRKQFNVMRVNNNFRPNSIR